MRYLWESKDIYLFPSVPLLPCQNFSAIEPSKPTLGAIVHITPSDKNTPWTIYSQKQEQNTNTMTTKHEKTVTSGTWGWSFSSHVMATKTLVALQSPFGSLCSRAHLSPRLVWTLPWNSTLWNSNYMPVQLYSQLYANYNCLVWLA